MAIDWQIEVLVTDHCVTNTVQCSVLTVVQPISIGQLLILSLCDRIALSSAQFNLVSSIFHCTFRSICLSTSKLVNKDHASGVHFSWGPCSTNLVAYICSIYMHIYVYIFRTAAPAGLYQITEPLYSWCLDYFSFSPSSLAWNALNICFNSSEITLPFLCALRL